MRRDEPTYWLEYVTIRMRENVKIVIITYDNIIQDCCQIICVECPDRTINENSVEGLLLDNIRIKKFYPFRRLAW